MKYRTIEEAQKVVIPNLSNEIAEDYRRLAKYIKLENANRTIKLRKIYDQTDKVTETVSPFMVCQKGCSHCCKIDVTISSVEAEYIHKNTGFTPNNGSSLSKGHSANKTPCTFLAEDETCSIYEFRPFACRTFFAYDNPEYCAEPGKFHITYSSRSNGMLDQLKNMIVFLNKNSPIRDIRDFFPTTKI
ncbi:YkgJ family cysteine cluster protein (plasmid) [Chromobacterium amazonense]|uniref:YkgJ family cysteine cluster protein n=1 Tax=Chromobacterium amazonense TaxID=1382803 RepID=UPI00237E285F|nr:YkgJ family cysteine cluster protein [Chromobacterium amazonense]MDE1712699.1 YkgJ family cysteine cluster protein [Chromobacterium amazonense]